MGEKLMTGVMIIIVIIFGPFIMTSLMNGRENNTSELAKIDTGRDVIIQINGENRLIDVEEYIAGVLPGFVDWRKGTDIIEAQAVAVRSKIYYAMGSDTVIWAKSLEYAYYEGKDLEERLGSSNYKKAKKIYEKAVLNTQGVVE